jgi:hypothetical protein
VIALVVEGRLRAAALPHHLTFAGVPVGRRRRATSGVFPDGAAAVVGPGVWTSVAWAGSRLVYREPFGGFVGVSG